MAKTGTLVRPSLHTVANRHNQSKNMIYGGILRGTASSIYTRSLKGIGENARIRTSGGLLFT